MAHVRFEGFSPGLFQFLEALAQNNNKPWFDEHRRQYEAEVLAPTKGFVAAVGPMIRTLNPEMETEPQVGRTLSRIRNDVRSRKHRPPYRPFVFAYFARRGARRSGEPLLYATIRPQGFSIAFHPGGDGEKKCGPIQESIKANLRLFQRYLDRSRIAETYWELSGSDDAGFATWPLPRTARRWINLESFTVGEHFAAADPALSRRTFLGLAQKTFLDLYPLWIFACSADPKTDLDLYWENVERLSRPLTAAAD